MEKKNSLKEDHEEIKLSLGDTENRNPISEVGSATVPLRAVVEERIVSFKLGDLEEAPERERLPSVDLKEETSIDSTVNGELTLKSFTLFCSGEDATILDLMLFVLKVTFLVLARCSTAA
jgi:sodium-dependent phosphate transporter